MTDRPMPSRPPPSDPLRPGYHDRDGPTGLADVLERVLDKGIVVAGDVQLNLLDIEVLTLKVRLLVASADTAQQMGVDWWKDDPFLSRQERERQRKLEDENEKLRQRLRQLDGSDEGGGEARAANGEVDGESGHRNGEDELNRRLERLEEIVAQGLGPAAHQEAGASQPPDDQSATEGADEAPEEEARRKDETPEDPAGEREDDGDGS